MTLDNKTHLMAKRDIFERNSQQNQRCELADLRRNRARQIVVVQAPVEQDRER
jgi:hypothetical protein